MKPLSRLELQGIPELQGETRKIILTKKELQDFLKALRQDYYSPKKLKREPAIAIVDLWLDSIPSHPDRFLLAEDEPDDHAKNDGWGKWELFACTALRVSPTKVRILKSRIAEFVH